VVDALQEADRHKDQFLAALSHEMRNPLSSINLSTQALKRLQPDAPSPQRRLLGIIERQLEQLVALVDDLTDMASIRSGKIVLRPQPLVAQDLVARALEACGPAIEARRQRLHTALPAAPVSLHGDPVRLGQVLVNLLHNAVKYTPEEGLIEVWLSATDDEVLIEVRDTGVGLSAEQLPQVFELYMQVAMGPRPQRSGLGIGLALVRQFVELHGGSVSVFSAGLGQGSRFSVRLPRRPPPAPAG
jgi:signal transduction histidine kinase